MPVTPIGVCLHFPFFPLSQFYFYIHEIADITQLIGPKNMHNMSGKGSPMTRVKDIKVHEKSCPDKTFKCPYNNCGSIMKLEDFDEHALKT